MRRNILQLTEEDWKRIRTQAERCVWLFEKVVPGEWLTIREICECLEIAFKHPFVDASVQACLRGKDVKELGWVHHYRQRADIVGDNEYILKPMTIADEIEFTKDTEDKRDLRINKEPIGRKQPKHRKKNKSFMKQFSAEWTLEQIRLAELRKKENEGGN